MQVLLMNHQIDPLELDFLLRFPAVPNVTSPVDFLSNFCWGGIKALSNLEQFKNLDRDIEVCTLSTCMLFNVVCYVYLAKPVYYNQQLYTYVVFPPEKIIISRRI